MTPPRLPSPSTPDFVVWFDALPALELFFLCQSQWRHGFNGITGLDYTAVIAVIALHEPCKARQRQLLAEIAALETGALKAFSEQQAKELSKHG